MIGKLLAAAVIAAAAAPASAAVTPLSCFGVDYSLTPFFDRTCSSGTGSQGNDSIIDENFSLFGDTGWLQSDKVENQNGSPVDVVDGPIGFTDAPTNGETATASWAISDPTGIASKVAIILKQANSFAAFLVTDSNGVTSTSGAWMTAGPGNNTTNGLSHASVFYLPGSTAVVPLPAAGWLLLSALGAAGLIARRRPA